MTPQLRRRYTVDHDPDAVTPRHLRGPRGTVQFAPLLPGTAAEQAEAQVASWLPQALRLLRRRAGR